MLLSGRVAAKDDGFPNLTDVNRICKEANFDQFLFEATGRFLITAKIVRPDRKIPGINRPSSAMLSGTTNSSLCRKRHGKPFWNWSSSSPPFAWGGPPLPSVQRWMGLSPCLPLRLQTWPSPNTSSARPSSSSASCPVRTCSILASNWGSRSTSAT